MTTVLSQHLKCQYLPFMYLVLGLIFGMVVIVIAPAPQNLATLAQELNLPIPCSVISSIRFIKGMAVLSPSFITINSASVVLSATSIYIFEAQVTGHPAYIITYLSFILLLTCPSAPFLPSSCRKNLHHTIVPCFDFFLY